MDLNHLGILWDYQQQSCYFNKIVYFPVPQAKDKQYDLYLLDNAFSVGELHYLHHSKFSKASMDQPVHCACALAASVKWTYDVGFLIIINEEFKHFGLPPVPKIDNVRIIIIVAMFSHVLMSSCDSHDEFKKI